MATITHPTGNGYCWDRILRDSPLSEEMGLSSCLVFVCVLQPLLVHCSNSLVTCGSALKLQHVKTNVRLHSHEVNYGSGSGQQVPQVLLVYCLYNINNMVRFITFYHQSVTGISHSDDVNSYWLVGGKHGERCQRGLVVPQTVRISGYGHVPMHPRSCSTLSITPH